MSSISDILTAAKNIVTALNGLGQTYLSVVGAQLTGSISAATLVKSGGGRIARISVTVAGSSEGSIYDAANANATSVKIASIPNTVGVTEINLPVNSGIVVAPGTGQTVVVSYS